MKVKVYPTRKNIAPYRGVVWLVGARISPSAGGGKLHYNPKGQLIPEPAEAPLPLLENSARMKGEVQAFMLTAENKYKIQLPIVNILTRKRCDRPTDRLPRME